jgi:hypothetical protein
MTAILVGVLLLVATSWPILHAGAVVLIGLGALSIFLERAEKRQANRPERGDL